MLVQFQPVGLAKLAVNYQLVACGRTIETVVLVRCPYEKVLTVKQTHNEWLDFHTDIEGRATPES